MSAAIPPNLLAEVMAFAENLPPGDNKVAWVLSELIIQGGFYSGKGSEIRLAVHIEALKYEIEGSLRDQISEMSQMLSSLDHIVYLHPISIRPQGDASTSLKVFLSNSKHPYLSDQVYWCA